MPYKENFMDYTGRKTFPPPLAGEGQGGGVKAKLAGSRAGAREFAIGFIAALVNAVLGLRDYGLQLPDSILLFFVFRVHRMIALTDDCDQCGDGATA
jgi:hypothetical protein